MRRYVDCATLRPFSATYFRWRKRLNCLAEGAKSGVVVLIIYLVVKLLFTSVSFGSGVPGGIFMPIQQWEPFLEVSCRLLPPGWLPQEYVPVFAICAMAGTLLHPLKPHHCNPSHRRNERVIGPYAARCCMCFIGLLVSDILKLTPYMRHCYNVSSTETALL